jgi:uncharacterized lipoprotein YajG
MIKKVFYILISALILGGCAERGSIVSVTPKHNKATQKTEAAFPKLTLSSSREDKVQKNISGSLILVIGLLLIL